MFLNFGRGPVSFTSSLSLSTVPSIWLSILPLNKTLLLLVTLVAWRPSNPSPIMRLVASGSPGEALGLDGFTPAKPGWNSTDEDGISYPGKEEYCSQGAFPRCIKVWATSNSSISFSGTRMERMGSTTLGWRVTRSSNTGSGRDEGPPARLD